MTEDHDLVRFLCGEMDDEELERFHDLLEQDPDKQQQLKDLEMALRALRELRPERPANRSLWLLRVAGLLLAFLAGAVAKDWLVGAEEAPRANSQQEFYDRYVEQPADRSSLSRLMVALGKAGNRR